MHPQTAHMRSGLSHKWALAVHQSMTTALRAGHYDLMMECSAGFARQAPLQTKRQALRAQFANASMTWSFEQVKLKGRGDITHFSCRAMDGPLPRKSLASWQACKHQRPRCQRYVGIHPKLRILCLPGHDPHALFTKQRDNIMQGSTAGGLPLRGGGPDQG